MIKFSTRFDNFDYNRIIQIVKRGIMSTVLEPISADKELVAMAAFAKAFRVVRPHAKLIGPDGNEIAIPKAIYKVLEQVIPLLASDKAVSIVPINHMLTTQEASDLLNVSRPYLIKLLDQRIIPFERSDDPGSHRRIRFVDLMAYKHKVDMQRREQLRMLTQMSQEAGLYDDQR